MKIIRTLICEVLILLSAFILLFICTDSSASEKVVNLVVGYKTVYFAGRPIQAIAVNNQIPGPTLHFQKDDHITIYVHNCLNKETAIHWHGVLVPWQMDGVLGISQQGIQPGKTFKYQFTLKQSGTYWYHAHAGLQEQQGLYGAFIIDPQQPTAYQYTKDYVIVLSDWSNTHPDQILANLKKDGDYYSPRFPLQPSLTKFIHDYRKANCEERKKLLDDYKMMQQMRMSIYDINDVAYDAFLINGHTRCNPWTGLVQVGDIVRLRFIGAGAETIFQVKIPGAKVQMVHVQGNDVVPYYISDFTVAPGETYDILVKIEKNTPYTIYAESADTVGSIVGALVTYPYQFVNYNSVLPFPEPKPVTREMMDNMMMMMNMKHGSMSMSMTSHKMMNMSSKHSPQHETMQMDMSAAPKNQLKNSMKHERTKTSHHTDSMTHETMKMMPSHDHTSMVSNMKMKHSMKMGHHMAHGHHMEMPTEATIIGDKLLPPTKTDLKTQTMGTKYQDLQAAIQTNDADKPIRAVIKMELFGYMNHFIWMINGFPEYKVHPIPLEPAKCYRIIFTNNSMMHHPMHIHGHWFILRNGHGAYDPLLHTVDVPPGSTVVADIDADASGQWFFHCHMIYHMVAGLSRVFQYSTLIEITKGEAEPQNIVKDTKYINRPIVRVDEARSIDPSLVKHPMAHPMGYYFANFLDVGADPFHNVQRITYKGLYGPDYNKLELFLNDAEINKGTVENADIDIFYWHLLSQFWAIKGGVNYYYRPAPKPYWQPGIGIEGLMPYFIDTDVRGYYYAGSAKLDVELSRDTQITNNFFVRLGVRSILATKTVNRGAIGSGLNQMRYIVRPYYRLMPGLNLDIEYEHEEAYGAYRTILRNLGDSTSEDTVTFGFSILF